jgi:hypothetical protein
VGYEFLDGTELKCSRDGSKRLSIKVKFPIHPLLPNSHAMTEEAPENPGSQNSILSR